MATAFIHNATRKDRLEHWNAAYRLQGQTDTDLNAEGVRMAQEAAREYKAYTLMSATARPFSRIGFRLINSLKPVDENEPYQIKNLRMYFNSLI